MDDNLPNTPGHPPAPARLPITDISQWIEHFSIMAAILATHFPDKAPELWAYQATIVGAEHNYDGKRWVTYDLQYRGEALARKDLNWSITILDYIMKHSPVMQKQFHATLIAFNNDVRSRGAGGGEL